jgi:hypothetical protein
MRISSSFGSLNRHSNGIGLGSSDRECDIVNDVSLLHLSAEQQDRNAIGGDSRRRSCVSCNVGSSLSWKRLQAHWRRTQAFEGLGAGMFCIVTVVLIGNLITGCCGLIDI